MLMRHLRLLRLVLIHLVEQGGLPVGDEAPVLHGPGAEVGDGDHVLLGQRERRVEVSLVVGEDAGPDV